MLVYCDSLHCGVAVQFKHVHSSVHQEAAAGGAVICGPVSMNSAEFDQENRGDVHLPDDASVAHCM